MPFPLRLLVWADIPYSWLGSHTQLPVCEFGQARPLEGSGRFTCWRGGEQRGLWRCFLSLSLAETSLAESTVAGGRADPHCILPGALSKQATSSAVLSHV